MESSRVKPLNLVERLVQLCLALENDYNDYICGTKIKMQLP